VKKAGNTRQGSQQADQPRFAQDEQEAKKECRKDENQGQADQKDHYQGINKVLNKRKSAARRIFFTPPLKPAPRSVVKNFFTHW
jgi:hypothetical protein